MRVTPLLSLVVLLSVFASPVHAQDVTAPSDGGSCRPVAPFQVDVTLTDKTATRGTLLCLGAREVTILSKGGATTFAMQRVGKIATPPDPLWDGAVKGVLVGALLSALCLGECSTSEALRMIGTYGAIGALIDSFDSHAQTLYDSRSPRLMFRVKF